LRHPRRERPPEHELGVELTVVADAVAPRPGLAVSANEGGVYLVEVGGIEPLVGQYLRERDLELVLMETEQRPITVEGDGSNARGVEGGGFYRSFSQRAASFAW
jgi:hypothetical protein